MQRDGVNNIKLVQVLAPAARTADASGEIQRSVHGPAGILWFEVNMGAEGVTLSGTDKIEVVVNHGAATSPSGIPTAADIITPQDAPAGIQFAPDSGGKIMTFDANAEIPGAFRFGYVGTQDFVEVSFDFSGTHGTATPCAVTAILGDLAFSPDA